MFHLDNNSGIDVMPKQKQTISRQQKWFTEGDTQTPPSYPGADWFNIIQAELLNVLKDGDITPSKSELSQLSAAIKSIINKNQIKINDASLTTKGVVNLNSAINSTSETEAATPKAVKSAYDLASNAVKKSGDEITGQLRFLPTSYGIKFLHENGNGLVLRPSGDSFVYAYYNSESNTWTNKLRYVSSSNTWRFENVDDVTISGKSVLKTGDYGIGSLTGAQLNNPDETLLGGCYATRTTSFPELTEYKNRNDSASLIVYPAWTPKWYVEKLAVVHSKTPRIYYRCATPEGKQKWHEAITTANINNYLPVGVPLPWPTNQPPAGWLECNGSTFDKNKFPKLAVAYPTGILPDLRGEFIRGWDNARGVDPGRGILSWQGDAIRNMVGSMGFTELNRGVQTSGAFYVSANPYASMTYHSRGDGFNTVVTFDASRTVPVSHDNHPRNVAFMYIVKAE